MNLRILILSERSPAQKDTHWMIAGINVLEYANCPDRRWIVQAQAGREGRPAKAQGPER